MDAYSLALSRKLAETAEFVIHEDSYPDAAGQRVVSGEARRTILHLSRLSAEITLKALLQKAGQPIEKIKSRKHNLSDLLNDLSACEIHSPDIPSQVSACNIRDQIVDPQYADASIGALIDAQSYGISNYPNEIRYDEKLNHFRPELMNKLAFKILEWAELHWDTVHS